MNRLIIIPLTLMVLTATFSTVLGFEVIQEHTLTYEEYELRMNTTETGTTTEWEMGMPASSDVSFSLFSGLSFILLLTGIVAVGIASGITVLGSGLSPQAQKLVFLFGMYFGVWGILSAVSYNLIARMDLYGAILWIALTLSYVLGFAGQISGDSGE